MKLQLKAPAYQPSINYLKQYDYTDFIRSHCARLRLYQVPHIFEMECHVARKKELTHSEFLYHLLETEVWSRYEKGLAKRHRAANLPSLHNLSDFDFTFSQSISESRLRELVWIQQAFNVILIGPSGTGKTFIATGLIHNAVQSGFRANILTMKDLISTIRLKNLTPTYLAAYQRLLRLHLLAIDDIMHFPLKKKEAIAFFNLINTLHEKTSIIVTTNKTPTEWAQTLDDPVLAAAILDRLMFKCEIIKLAGNSYRMKNRQTIFKNYPS